MDRRNFLRLTVKAIVAATAAAAAPSLAAGALKEVAPAQIGIALGNAEARAISWELRRLGMDIDIKRREYVSQATIAIGPEAPPWVGRWLREEGSGVFMCEVHIPYEAIDGMGLDYRTVSMDQVFHEFMKERIDVDVQDMARYTNKAAFLGVPA